MASVIAVAGTLAGATMTFIFGLHIERRSRRFARTERLRNELQASCAAFAAAVNHMRRCAEDRWLRRREDAEGRDSPGAANAFYGARTDAWAVYYRMVLAGADEELCTSAEQAITAAGDIIHATDEAARLHRREAAADVITRFAFLAAARLGASDVLERS